MKAYSDARFLPLAALLGVALLISGCSGEVRDPVSQVAPPSPTTQPSAAGSANTTATVARAPGQPPCEDGMDCAAPAVSGSPAPTRATNPSPPRGSKAVATKRSARTPRAPVNAPSGKARLDRDALKQLERSPGSTPALKQVAVKPGPKHASLEGQPGPSPGFGPDDAPVKVFVFSDFQCPVCRRVVEPVKKLARDYGDQVQIVFLQNALKMHRQAEIAAAASMAAFKQGKFWEYHDALFSNRGGLGRDNLIAVAQSLKLDVGRFTADLDAPAIRQQIAYERSLASKLGATGTPGFFINGQKLVGWGSYIGFKSMVDRALRAAKAVPAGTPKKAVARVATAAAGEDGARFVEFYWGEK